MKGLKALAAVLVATGLLASVIPASASAAAYKHYVACGVQNNSKPAHVCPNKSKKGAFFESVKRGSQLHGLRPLPEWQTPLCQSLSRPKKGCST